jgi:alcohol dehydrogenase class IV
MNDIDLESHLKDLGINQDDFQTIIDNGFNPQRVINNPVKITEETVLRILENIL